MPDPQDSAVLEAAETLVILRAILSGRSEDHEVCRGLFAAPLCWAIDAFGLFSEGVFDRAARILPYRDSGSRSSEEIWMADPSLQLCYLRAWAVAYPGTLKGIGHLSESRIVNAVDALLRGAAAPELDENGVMAGVPWPKPTFRGKWGPATPSVRRYGMPRARSGELKAQWGSSADAGTDLFFCGGDGVGGSDRALLHYALSCPRFAGPMGDGAYEPSLIEELVLRGYDPQTLRFSIRKREPVIIP